TYDEVEEANSHGISARAKVNFYRDNKGVFLNMNWQGIHLMAGDFLVGYAKRSRDAWFLEAGAGLAYSEIWGAGYGLLASTGYRFNRGLFLTFPLIYRGGAQTLLFWSPYIGMEFSRNASHDSEKIHTMDDSLQLRRLWLRPGHSRFRSCRNLR